MADPTDLTYLDATAQAALVRTGDVSATELVDAAIERAEAVNGDLNAIIHPRYDQAREEAEGPLGDGPFAGVPFVLKDLDGVAAGQPLHAGTRFLRDHGYVATTDSELTTRFRRAGLICIGRTNTPELGLVPSTEPEVYGPTHNPWDLTRTPGGSSGGSATAVAAGIVPLGHAGDGGGSIRIPAAHCGLVGLKPGRGRITMGPELGEAWAGLVARLAVTRTVRDTAALLDAVAGPGVGDPYRAAAPMRPYLDEMDAEPESLRIGWVATPPDGNVTTDPQVVAATEATAEMLAALGHRVEEAHPSVLAGPASTEHFLVAFGAWTARELDRMGEMVGAEPTAEGFEAGTWAVAESGRAITAPQYLAALDGLHAFTRAMVAWWEVDGYDLLLTPTVPELPPTLGQFGSTPESPFDGLFRATTTVAFCAPFNITGQPAISLPLHQSTEGLPIGMQFVAAPEREDLLIRLAAQLEEVSPWVDRHPPIWYPTDS
ncbi:MAG: amidase [Acidimicrobiales bacterium]